MENGRLGIKKCGKKKMSKENGRLGILKIWWLHQDMWIAGCFGSFVRIFGCFEVLPEVWKILNENVNEWQIIN